MKFIMLFFITVAWIVSLVPLMLLTIMSSSIGLSLCFIAIMIFISGQFVDLILQEL